MAKSIFKILKDNSSINSVLKVSLHSFMLQGGFSKSDIDRFICKNYMLSVPELTRIWNVENATDKKELTFRGQISVLSNKFLHLFETNASELEEVLLSENDKHPKALEIIGIIIAFGVSSDSLEHRFKYTLEDYIGIQKPVNDYDISECEAEIKLLRMMDKQNLISMFEKVDKDKLAYVMQMMRADLVLYEVSEYEQVDKGTKQVIKKADGSVSVRKVLNPVINDLKKELLLQFNKAKAKELYLVKQVKDNSSTNGVPISEEPEVSIPKPKKVPKPSVKKGCLNITQEHLVLLQEKYNEKATVDDINGFSFDLVDEYKAYLLSLTVDTDVDELSNWLSSVNRNVFTSAWDELTE